MSNTNQTLQHPFESANLGKAPFQFLKVEKEPSSCSYCGTGIIWKFLVESSDKKVFGVGCDCIQKVDYSMYCAAKNAKKNAIRAERLSVVAKARRTQFEKNLKEFEIVEPEISAYLTEAVRINNSWGEMTVSEREGLADRNDIAFCCSLHSQIGRFGKLSDKQLTAIRNIVTAPKKVEIPSNHVGEVGGKIALEVTLKFYKHFESQFGTYSIVSMSDEQGNEIVYKGSTIEFLSIETRHEDGSIARQGYMEPGEKVKLTAKVKEHTFYQGKKQTVIGYVKKAKETTSKKSKGDVQCQSKIPL
jgi:hypothetical protein